MRTLNLCIDYSNICFRALFTCKYGNSDITTFDTEEECDIFARKVTNDICALVKTFSPNEVFLFMDSKDPWRGNICPDYKGTRKRDDSINMKNILTTMDELVDIYKTRGIVPMRITHAEADDVAAMFKYRTKNMDCSSIFVSSDADWQQLIEFDEKTKKYICVYNPLVGSKAVTKFFCTEKCKEWIETNDSMDVFCDYTSTKRKIVEGMAFNQKINLSVINPEDVLVSKILFGDDGDNVPAFFQYYKNGRKTRLTEKKLEKVSALLETKISTVNDLEKVNENNSFVETIGKVFKYDTSSIDGKIQLSKQRDYVELNPERFPDQIKEDYNILFDNYLKNKQLGVQIPKTVEIMMKGTKFEKKSMANNGAKLNKIFAGFIDKPVPTAKSLF